MSIEETVVQYRRKLASGNLDAEPSYVAACEAAEGMGFNDYMNDQPHQVPLSALATAYRRGWDEAKDLDELRRRGQIPC